MPSHTIVLDICGRPIIAHPTSHTLDIASLQPSSSPAFSLIPVR